MTNLKEIEKKVNVKENLGLDSKMVFFSFEILVAGPCYCGDIGGAFIWANNTTDILNYLLEKLTSYLLISEMSIHSGFNAEDKFYNFEEASSEYLKFYDDDKKRISSLKELIKYYNQNFDKEFDYATFIKKLEELCNILSNMRIDIKMEPFYSAVDARYSEYFNDTKFNFDDLSKNFIFE